MKVIFWGHKHNYNTFYYIHYAYSKAFKHLGYEVYWIDKTDLSNFVNFYFKDTIFFTEGSASDNEPIPLISGCLYILHNCNHKKYLDAGCKIINLCNYVRYCEDGMSFNYKETGNTVEKIKDFVFYDKKAFAMYQPWATDLLPYEIDVNQIVLHDENKPDFHFIGTIWQENVNQVNPFVKSCIDHRKNFKPYARISFEDANRLVKESYIDVDFRGDWGKECGFIPCRIWKDISYGRLVGTNSYYINRAFSNMLPYNNDTYGLFETTVYSQKNMSTGEMVKLKTYIKNNHTYINRINDILEYADVLYK